MTNLRKNFIHFFLSKKGKGDQKLKWRA